MIASTRSARQGEPAGSAGLGGGRPNAAQICIFNFSSKSSGAPRARSPLPKESTKLRISGCLSMKDSMTFLRIRPVRISSGIRCTEAAGVLSPPGHASFSAARASVDGALRGRTVWTGCQDGPTDGSGRSGSSSS